MSFDESNPRKLGIRVGGIPFPSGPLQPRGYIEVWIHWILIVVALFHLLFNYLRLPPEEPLFMMWLAYTIALCVSVFLHELGHCYAAYRQGGGAERIVLWPLGGLGYCDAPHEPRSQFWVAAGGPMVTVLLMLLAITVCLALGWNVFPGDGSSGDGSPGNGEGAFSFGSELCQSFALWNVVLLVVNLIPCYPLDGGRMLQATLWEKLGSYSHGALLTLRISHVGAAISLVVALLIFVGVWVSSGYHPLLFLLSLGLVLVAMMYYVEGKALQQRLLQGDVEDGIFGYDFSGGYTSLERTATREQKRTSLLGAWKEQFRQRSRTSMHQKEISVRKRVDELLLKIHSEGMASLTRAEHRFLKKASKMLKK
jgi:Zn-dependent protease